MKKKAEAVEKEQWTAAAWDMLYLVQCGIHSVVPDPDRVAGMDLEKVYARSKSQSLEALTCMALESLLESDPQIQIPDQNQVLSKWKNAKNKAIAKNLMMDAAREQLFAFLEEQGIWHVALKGAVLCHMYPKYGMRQMADNDILFDPFFRQEVHDWFVEQGYEVESFQENAHDVYLKQPVYNFEMHTALFYEGEPPQLIRYYQNVKDRLVQEPGTSFEYRMTDEDFYLYIVAHEYKHYVNRGTGLRSLLDLYLCSKAKNNMNHRYLEEELGKTGLLAFEHEMSELANKICASMPDSKTLAEALSEREQVILKNLMSGDTYGAMETYWNNQVRKLQSDGGKISAGVKLSYLLRRIYPGREYMETWSQEYAPYLFRHRWLMPAAPVWRMIKRGIEKKKQVKEELDVVKKA